jgi:hypothetical protein
MNKFKKLADNKWFILVCIIVLVGLLAVSFRSVLVKDNASVSEDTVKSMLKDIYTPKSTKYYNDKRNYYIKNNIITSGEGERLFKSVDKLSEDDLSREINIVKVEHSYAKNNSYGDDLYKVDFNVKYKGNTSNLEVLFFVNKDGCIYNHEVSEVN